MIRFVTCSVAFCIIAVAMPAHASSSSTPKWTLLNSPKAPSDALRWNGNARPTSSYAQRQFDDVAKKKKRLHKELADWADTNTPRGEQKRERIRAELAALDPVICRGSVGRKSYLGELHEDAGVCVLFKARNKHLMCQTQKGPDCRYHLPVLGEEIYVLRGANNVTLSEIGNDVNTMPAPFSAMINTTSKVFGSKTPICLDGNVAGVVFKEGPRYRCETHGARRTSAGGRLYGYADLKAYHAIALKPVIAYLAMHKELLIDSMVSLKSIKTLEQARAAMTTLDDSLARFNSGLRASVKKVQSGARRAAGKLVQETVGALIEKNERYRKELEATIERLALHERAMAFWDEHMAPVASAAQEVAGRKELPSDLASGKKEAEEVDALVTTIERMTKRFEALEPEVKERVATHLRRVARDLESSLKRVFERQKALTAYVALETKKAEADQLAATVKKSIAGASGFSGNAKEALKVVTTLDALRTEIDKALAEAVEKALTQHRRRTLAPVRAPLIEAMETIEPQLEGKERLKRLRLTIERIPDSEVTIASSATATSHVLRLMKADDDATLQMEMVRALAEYRNRVMTVLAERVDAGFRCEAWEDCESGVDMKLAHDLMSSLYALPKSVKARVKNREGKALAADLRDNGYQWQWPEEPSDTGDTFNGPWVTHKGGALRSALKSKLASPTTLWLSCREEQLVGNYVTPAVLFKACARAAKGLEGGPLMKDIEAAVLKVVGEVKNHLSAKQCLSLKRKHKRAFFNDALSKECDGIKEKEKREKNIARWQKKIQSAIKQKRFGKARGMLSDLRDAGAQDWSIQNLDRAIDQAIEYDRNRKAHKAAQKRAKRLMSRLPSYESTCKAKKKAYLYADKQVRNAARRGRPQAAQRHEKKKWAAAEKACNAQRNVLEVYQIYKSWGNNTAADAVLRGATTCMRFWRCN